MTDASDDRNDWPTSGPNEPVPTWDEYDQLKEAVHDYLDHDPDEPGFSNIWRALGAILGEYQRDAFAAAHDLAGPAETACIARLIDGRDECPHNAVDEDDDPNAPPHQPPVTDHATLWLDEDGGPALYGMHIYPGDLEHPIGEDNENQWFEIAGFAQHFGLELSVHTTSWYNLGSTVHIVFYPPERYRSVSES